MGCSASTPITTSPTVSINGSPTKLPTQSTTMNETSSKSPTKLPPQIISGTGIHVDIEDKENVVVCSANVDAGNKMESELNNTKLRPVVISGPSGCGKSTLIKRLMAEFPNKFGFSVSHTTRNMRPGEVAGSDYHYTTQEDMAKQISNGSFLEHATYSNNMYGTSKKAVQDVQDAGHICILDIDSQGVKSVKAASLDCLLIFVKPPSLDELERRLRGRGTETEEAIASRIALTSTELAYADQPGAYHHMIVNDHLDKAYGEFVQILTQAYEWS